MSLQVNNYYFSTKNEIQILEHNLDLLGKRIEDKKNINDIEKLSEEKAILETRLYTLRNIDETNQALEAAKSLSTTGLKLSLAAGVCAAIGGRQAIRKIIPWIVPNAKLSSLATRMAASTVVRSSIYLSSLFVFYQIPAQSLFDENVTLSGGTKDIQTYSYAFINLLGFYATICSLFVGFGFIFSAPITLPISFFASRKILQRYAIKHLIPLK